MKRKALIATLGIAVFTAVGMLGLPLLSKTTNCGGNTAAWSNCRTIYSQLSLIDKGHQSFSVPDLPKEDRLELARFGSYHWTGEAHYLVKRQVRLAPDSEEVIALCDTSFDNMPQPTIFNGYKRTTRYAVALANGKVKLFTPEEFSRIDRSQFIKASELVKTEEVAKQ